MVKKTGFRKSGGGATAVPKGPLSYTPHGPSLMGSVPSPDEHVRLGGRAERVDYLRRLIDAVTCAESQESFLAKIDALGVEGEVVSSDENREALLIAWRANMLSCLDEELISPKVHQPDDPFEPENRFKDKLLEMAKLELAKKLPPEMMDRVALSVYTSLGTDIHHAFGAGVWLEIVRLNDSEEVSQNVLGRYFIELGVMSKLGSRGMNFFSIPSSESNGLTNGEFTIGKTFFNEPADVRSVGEAHSGKSVELALKKDPLRAHAFNNKAFSDLVKDIAKVLAKKAKAALKPKRKTTRKKRSSRKK